MEELDNKIFGIGRSNLCDYQLACKNRDKCSFHHPLWGQNLCIAFTKRGCKFGQNCRKKHISWNDLDEIATENSTLDIFKRSNTYLDIQRKSGLLIDK